MTTKIFIVAGEPSGDLLAAGFIRKLRDILPEAECVGVAGPHMRAAGCQAFANIEDLSVMGYIEVLRRLPKIMKLRRSIVSYCKKNPPVLFIGVDAPSFNLDLELAIRRLGIKVFHVISPKIWAWKSGRIDKIARAVNKMFCFFPFETDLYKVKRIPCEYVGHPFADEIPLETNMQAAREALGLGEGRVLALLPGSRESEIEQHTLTFLLTAKRCQQDIPDLECVMPMFSMEQGQRVIDIVQQLGIDIPIKIVPQQTRKALAAADVVLVASGTATLEAMLFKKPMVIAYRMAPLSAMIMRRLIRIPFVGLPNILLSRYAVPEFLQEKMQVPNLAKAVLHYFNSPEAVEDLQREFTEMHERLRCNAHEKIAQAIATVCQRAKA